MSTNPEAAEFFGAGALPVVDPAAVQVAYDEIVARHVLATLRRGSGLSLEEVASAKGVSKAAVHQLENRPLGKVQISSMISYLQAVGYDVDEDWVARTLTAALPVRT